MKTKGIFLIIILIASAFALQAPSAHAATGGYGMYITGPTVAATNTTVSYTVTISGIFDEYKCLLLMGGENLTGASPVNQIEQSNYNGIFKFSVKTPLQVQKLYLDFRGVGMVNSTHQIKTFERKITVDIKNTYTIIASIKNVENYTIESVTVNFYVDGNYIGNSTVYGINANTSKNVTYEWVPDVGNGVHSLKMKVGVKGIIFENGKQSYSREIYIGTPPNYNWIGYLGIATAVGLASLFTLMLMGRKRRGTTHKPKWKQ